VEANPVNLVNPVNVHSLLVATRNPHKTREFAEILGGQTDVCDLANAAEFPEIDETGKSFEENAILKAVETSRHFSGLVVADDSGLEVDALQGAPGIYSARYAGEKATDAENVAKLLGELRNVGAMGPASARFRCCLALAERGELKGTFQGVVEGVIVMGPRGNGGFGYDPVFQPEGFDRTFAELSPEQKNRISHRARAIEALGRKMIS